MGTLRYIADSPPEAHGGFAEQTVAAAKWALAEIERLQAENDRLRAAAAQAIEVLERVPGAYQKREELDSLWYDARLAIARLRAIVEKGTE
jgi:hypothetical protein